MKGSRKISTAGTENARPIVGVWQTSPHRGRKTPRRSRPLSQLTVHPAVSLAWEMPDLHPRFQSLVRSIMDQGVLDPLKITEAGQVVDGRHRLRAAKIAGLESVECIVVPEERVGEIALATLTERRHLVTRGQLAYAAYPLFAEGHRELQAKNSELIRTGAKAAVTVEDYAEQIGVSRDLFFQAARLHLAFDGDPELKAEWEPKIMAAEDPIGLGAAIAGIRGQEVSTERTPARNTALHNWEVAWRNLVRPAAAWDRWSPEERDQATRVLRDEFSRLPDPVLDAVRDALRATRRSRAGADNADSKLERLGLLTPNSQPELDDGETPAEAMDRECREGNKRARQLSVTAREKIRAAAAARWGRFPAPQNAEA